MTRRYQVISDPETGLYSFTTIKDVKYICRFRNVTSYLSPILGVYDIEIFDFEFYPEQQVKGKEKFDPAIYNTLTDLFISFFNTPLRVLTYICDSTDGKHKSRQILFGNWHRKHHAAQFMRLPVEINLDDDIIYGSILARHDFPHKELLHSYLIDSAGEIIAAKYQP